MRSCPATGTCSTWLQASCRCSRRGSWPTVWGSRLRADARPSLLPAADLDAVPDEGSTPVAPALDTAASGPAFGGLACGLEYGTNVPRGLTATIVPSSCQICSEQTSLARLATKIKSSQDPPAKLISASMIGAQREPSSSSRNTRRMVQPKMPANDCAGRLSRWGSSAMHISCLRIRSRLLYSGTAGRTPFPITSSVAQRLLEEPGSWLPDRREDITERRADSDILFDIKP